MKILLLMLREKNRKDISGSIKLSILYIKKYCMHMHLFKNILEYLTNT